MFNEIKDKLKDISIIKEPKRTSRNKNTITKIRLVSSHEGIIMVSDQPLLSDINNYKTGQNMEATEDSGQ